MVPETKGGRPERVASQFFNELDNLSDLSQVIILGATNREDLLDPALTRPGRLDFVLPFPVPDEAERLEIFRSHTKDKPLTADVDLEELARMNRRDGRLSDRVYLQSGRAMLAHSRMLIQT